MENRTQQLKSQVEELGNAVWSGNLQKVKSLVRNCNASELFATYKRTQTSIIHLALFPRVYGKSVSHSTRQNILEELVRAGADVNESDRRGAQHRIPLMLAILVQDLKLCKLLVTLGADVNFLNHINQQCDPTTFYNHRTPLSDAVISGPEFVAFLLENNAQLTDCDDKICTGSTLYNALSKHKPDVILMLMDWYEKSKRCFPWNEAIIVAMKYRHQDHVTAILHREYHLHESPDPVFAYFHTAASNGLTNGMRLLLEQQPQVLQADWLVNNNLPQALQEEQHRDFVAWLIDIRSQTLQLQLMCRNTILRQLRPRPEEKIDQLPLPNKMKEYLKLKEGLIASF